MNTDRRAILSLIAMGRITPREAERLLAILSDWDDAIARVGVVIAVAWMVVPHVHEILVVWSQAFDVVGPRLLVVGHHVFTSVRNVFGGAL